LGDVTARRVSVASRASGRDPDATPPEEFRLDLRAAVKGDVAPNAFGVVARTIDAIGQRSGRTRPSFRP
jgi:DNA gyrase inhibitor GyrI